MTESSDKRTSKGIGAHIKAVGAYSILLGFLAFGATMATIFWSSSNTNLQTDLRRSQDELTKARAELAEVKTEYAQYRGENQETKTEIRNENLSTNMASSQNNVPTNALDKVLVKIPTGQSGSFFNGDLLISLIENAFEGNPLRHKVIAVVGSPGYPNLKIDRKDIGYTVTFNGRATYDIRIVATDTFSATFLVTRKA
jgi:hypothetical protein